MPQSTSRRARIGLMGSAALIAAVIFTSPGAQAASDAEIKLLREQLRLMEQRLKELEAKQEETQATATETKRVVEEETIKSGGSLGTFVLPGTDTRVTISGYVKGDFIYDVSGDVGADDLFVAESIGVGAGNDTRFTSHARQSRLAVKTTTPSSFGPIKTLFEGDFFGIGGALTEEAVNSFSFRIRHAYGEVGNLGAGQFWTNFMPIEAYPKTVDFEGPAGLPFIRQGQLRWTQPVTDSFNLIFSAENSEFSGVADADGDPTTVGFAAFGDTQPGVLAGLDAGIDVAPDLVVTGIYRDDWGLARGSVVGRRFGGQNFGLGDGDGTFGWGVNGAASVNVTDSTNIRGSVTYGDGVGRYIINGTNDDGVIDAFGNVESLEAFGAAVQVLQGLTPDLQMGLAYGRYDQFDAVTPTSIEDLQTFHGSLFWSPFDRVTFGAEAIYGRVELANGAADDAVRLQTSVQVNF